MIVLFAGVAFALLYVSVAGIWYFEHEAQPEAFASMMYSLWWATATLTTVFRGVMTEAAPVIMVPKPTSDTI